MMIGGQLYKLRYFSKERDIVYQILIVILLLHWIPVVLIKQELRYVIYLDLTIFHLF